MISSFLFSNFPSVIDWGFGNLNGSLEQVQVELFSHQICGGSNFSIYQYAMVLICCKNGNRKLLSSNLMLHFFPLYSVLLKITVVISCLF